MQLDTSWYERKHSVTCSLCLQGRGFSVRPRRDPRESLTGLPGPVKVSGRVLIAVQDEAAVRADVGTYRETFRHALATAAAILAGERGWHGDNSFASVHCFAFEDGPERCPPRIRDALGEMFVPYHVGDPQLFEIEGIVGSEHIECGLRVKVGALPPYLLTDASCRTV